MPRAITHPPHPPPPLPRGFTEHELGWKEREAETVTTVPHLGGHNLIYVSISS